jgi:putative addiction module component (TIGR02574 family)
MSARADTILGTALELPPEERAWLAEELIASLDQHRNAEIESAWASEIERRVAEVESGDAETVGWDEVRARIRAKLAKS